MSFLRGLGQILSATTANILSKRSSHYSIWRKKMKDFDFKSAEHCKFGEIMDFLWENYFPHDPFMTAAQLNCNRCFALEEHICRCLREGLSIVAFCKANQCLSGVSINSRTFKGTADSLDIRGCYSDSPEFARYWHFLAVVDRAPELHTQHEIFMALQVNYLAIRQCEEGRGLEEDLIEASHLLGRDAGFKLFRVNAFTDSLAQHCESYRLVKICEIPYKTYVDDKNEPVFKLPEPNNSVKVYVDCPPN